MSLISIIVSVIIIIGFIIWYSRKSVEKDRVDRISEEKQLGEDIKEKEEIRLRAKEKMVKNQEARRLRVEEGENADKVREERDAREKELRQKIEDRKKHQAEEERRKAEDEKK